MADLSCLPALQKQIGVMCKKEALIDTSITLAKFALSGLAKALMNVSLSMFVSRGASIKATRS